MECKQPDCPNDAWRRGLCKTHYWRWYYGRDTTIQPNPPLPGGRKPAATCCAVDGCEKPGPYYRGWCRGHYWKWHKYGDPLGGWVRGACSVDGCARLAYARTWCRMHYSRWRATGETGEATPRRAVAGEGNVNNQGYRIIARKLEHRSVMEAALGRPLAPDETVHHVNGDRLDNRIENLQLRLGKHGKGVRYQCNECGSRDVKATPL